MQIRTHFILKNQIKLKFAKLIKFKIQCCNFTQVFQKVLVQNLP